MKEDYDYILSAVGACGHMSMWHYFKISNLVPINFYYPKEYKQIKNPHDSYINNHKHLIKQADTYGLVIGTTLMGLREKNTLKHLNKKVPRFFLFRDPISVIKSCVNEIGLAKYRRMVFGVNETWNKSDINNRLNQTLSKQNNRYILDISYYKSLIDFASHITSETYFFDTSDIAGKNGKKAYETMANIISLIGKGELKESSSYNVNLGSMFEFSMPSTPTLHYNDRRTFRIHIGLHHSFNRWTLENKLDTLYKDLFLLRDYKTHLRPNSKLQVVLAKSDEDLYLDILSNKNIMNEIQKRVDIFARKSFEMEHLDKERKIDEKYVIEYLHKNQAIANELKAHYKKEVEPIKYECKRIYDKWNFYKEFMSSC